jgi:hypothetical protein
LCKAGHAGRVSPPGDLFVEPIACTAAECRGYNRAVARVGMTGLGRPLESTAAQPPRICSGTRNAFRWRVVGSRGMRSNFQIPRFLCKAGHAGRVSPPGDLFVCGADCPHGSGVPWLQLRGSAFRKSQGRDGEFFLGENLQCCKGKWSE